MPLSLALETLSIEALLPSLAAFSNAVPRIGRRHRELGGSRFPC